MLISVSISVYLLSLRRAGACAPLLSPEVYSLLPFRLFCLWWQYTTPLTLTAEFGLHSDAFVLISYGCLFIISRQRGYIARYICDENTITRIIYIAVSRQCRALELRCTMRPLSLCLRYHLTALQRYTLYLYYTGEIHFLTRI